MESPVKGSSLKEIMASDEVPTSFDIGILQTWETAISGLIGRGK